MTNLGFIVHAVNSGNKINQDKTHEIVLVIDNNKHEYENCFSTADVGVNKALGYTHEFDIYYNDLLDIPSDDMDEITIEMKDKVLSQITFPTINRFHIVKLQDNRKPDVININTSVEANKIVNKYAKAYSCGYADGYGPAYDFSYWNSGVGIEETNLDEIDFDDFGFDEIEKSAYLNGFQHGEEEGFLCGREDS